MLSVELWQNILSATVFFLLLGATVGVLLAIADRLFAVKQDERIPKIVECLPGANCGGCGYSGCAACAEAIVNGSAKVSACPVGGEAAAAAIAAVMGVSAEKAVRCRAQILCCGTQDAAKLKYRYVGAQDCVAASRIGGGDKACPNGCIGLGSCRAICPFHAIELRDGIAAVNAEKCQGCGLCADVCPKHIIRLIPWDAKYVVGCSSEEKGALTRAACSAGCIGCRLCEKKCSVQAIRVEGSLAKIDYSLCFGCGECAKACPRGIIRAL